MSAALQTVLLLTLSNLFMGYAWYGHCRSLADKPSWIAALLSWGVPVMSRPQLKIVQEVITLVVFVPFAVWFMRVPVGLDFLWAGLCLLGAVFFVFRGVGVPL